MSKPFFLGLMAEDLIEPMTPFLKAWGHSVARGFFHGGDGNLKCLPYLKYNLLLSDSFHCLSSVIRKVRLYLGWIWAKVPLGKPVK